MGGLLVLLAMPAALIVIMALVQDAPFRDYQDLNFELLIADEDGGALSVAIKETLRDSKAFTLIDSMDGKALSAAALRENLRHGGHSIGLIIPKGATAEVVNAANTVANSVAAQFGNPPLPQRLPRDSPAISLTFDPVSRPAFRLAIHAALDKAVSGAATKLLLARITRISAGDQSNAPPDMQKMLSGLAVREEAAETGKAMPKHINSVQHNVPAWAIFGMFFIVVPLSGHIISEREEGSALRVKLIPGAGSGVAIGRIVASTAICCAQFALMCGVGRWLLPLAGLPALTLGAHPAAIIPVVFATGICATAYGNFIGTLFRSGTQALPFGAISIVMLSALGGVWVPVELLSPFLQAAAKLSPLYWGLQGVQSIILRDGSWSDICFPVGVLLSISTLLFVAAVWRERASTTAL